MLILACARTRERFPVPSSSSGQTLRGVFFSSDNHIHQIKLFVFMHQRTVLKRMQFKRIPNFLFIRFDGVGVSEFARSLALLLPLNHLSYFLQLTSSPFLLLHRTPYIPTLYPSSPLPSPQFGFAFTLTNLMCTMLCLVLLSLHNLIETSTHPSHMHLLHPSFSSSFSPSSLGPSPSFIRFLHPLCFFLVSLLFDPGVLF